MCDVWLIDNKQPYLTDSDLIFCHLRHQFILSEHPDVKVLWSNKKLNKKDASRLWYFVTYKANLLILGIVQVFGHLILAISCEVTQHKWSHIISCDLNKFTNCNFSIVQYLLRNKRTNDLTVQNWSVPS